MPDDVQLDRFRPRPPAPTDSSDTFPVGATPIDADATWSPLSVPTAAEPQPVYSPPQPESQPAQPVSTWDEWSHQARDTRERASLVVRLRGDRGAVGLAHERAVGAHRSRVRGAAAVTLGVVLPLTAGWVMVILARNASIEQGLGDRSFAPFGFLLLVCTVFAAVALLRWWASIYRDRPDPLRFDPLPDSPDAPRHGSFDGSTPPPVRW